MGKDTEMNEMGGNGKSVPPLERVGAVVDNTASRIFGGLGRSVAKRPHVFIIVSGILCLLCAIGMIEFYEETDGQNLWVPQKTRSLREADYVEVTYGQGPRAEYILGVPRDESANVLDKDYLLEFFDINEAVLAIEVEHEGTTYGHTDLCVYRGPACFVSSVFNAWGRNRDLLENDNDVVSTIQTIFNTEEAVAGVLGSCTYNGQGVLQSCGAIRTLFFLENTEELQEETAASKFEKVALNQILKKNDPVEWPLIATHPFLARSLGDEFGTAIGNDVGIFGGSYVLIIVYFCFMFASLDPVNSHVFLAFMSLASIGLSVLVSIGLSSAFGQFWSPVHAVFPFLLVGIGVDDAFVITSIFFRTTKDEDLKTRIGSTLAHAGVSITVTSLTDFIAFMLGSTTQLPALKSFCIYTGIGIVAVYFLQITWFAAWMAVDAMRSNAGRVDFCCCIKTDGEVKPATPGLLVRFMDKIYAPIIFHNVSRVIIPIVFTILFGFGIYGATQLEQEFTSFIPDNSYVQPFFRLSDVHFPQSGEAVSIYTTEETRHYEDFDKLLTLREDLQGVKHLKDTSSDEYFSSWAEDFQTYMETVHSDELVNGKAPTRAKFYEWLRNFVDGAFGARYAQRLVFEDVGRNNLKSTTFNCEFENLDSSQDQVEAMNSIRKRVDSLQIGAFGFTFTFINYETFKILEEELFINIGLSLGAVLIIMLITLANLIMAFLVLLMVGMTIVDVMGVMFAWGLYIDTVTVVNLVLAVGLAVDYSAHVAHAFLVERAEDEGGSRLARAKITVGSIGAAVANGGFSTFLAVALLGASQSYIFRVFFQQFFSITIFGLAHGLMLLPVLCSIFGPAPYTVMK